MPKYLIEGAIDFYSELYKSLDEDENNFKTEEDNNLCLITKQPLTTNYVTMECGHKFNYVPLFKDIDNHKRNFNNMEGNSGRLGKNEIRCPYCRKKQTTLLPYYENIGVPKVIGVNQTYIPPTYNETKINNTHWGPCEYLDHATQFGIFQDASGIIQEGSINTNVKCNCHGSPICINTYGTNYGDTKKYCYTHKRMMIRKYKKEILDKAKAEAKMVIQKAKEDAKAVLDGVKKSLEPMVEEEIIKMKQEYKIAKEALDSIPAEVTATVANAALPAAFPPAVPNPVYTLGVAIQTKKSILKTLNVVLSSLTTVLMIATKLKFKVPAPVIALIAAITTVTKLLSAIPG
jgi:hypothetical protein